MSIASKVSAIRIAIQKTRQLYNFQKTKEKWRELNPHNNTYAILDDEIYSFPIDKVKVGNHSYGGLKVSCFSNNGESLTIGHFCSIARGVKFILGGEHPYNRISTFPFKATLLNQFDAQSKGPIVIEDDVWIGDNSIVLSGVTLRRGTIVAAGSVVVKSTNPYSIVGGNPATLIKYRFSNEIIDKLLTIDYSTLTAEKAKKNLSILYTELSEENVDRLISSLKVD